MVHSPTLPSAQLKARTWDLHAQLDAHSTMRQLTQPDLSVAAYASILQGLWHCYHWAEQGLDAWLSDHPQHVALVDPWVFRRTADLEQDLQMLGYPVPRMDGCIAPLNVAHIAEAAGCMYVLGGASMGARMIERTLRAHGDPIAKALHFYGESQREGNFRFTDLRVSLDHLLCTAPMLEKSVCAARQVFSVFIDRMDQPCGESVPS